MAKKYIKFTDFDEMMSELKGVKFDEFLKVYPDLKNHVEEYSDYASIFACHDNNKLVTDIAKEQDWQIITYTLEDGEYDEDEDRDTSIAMYSTGMSFVNREKYLFCKSKKEGFCEEEF